MEGLTEIPEKMTAAEFEKFYNKALSRLREIEKRTALESLESSIRALIREELTRMFGGNSNGQKKN